MSGKKLTLQKETLRNLNSAQLHNVVGGGGWFCVTTHIIELSMLLCDTLIGNTVDVPETLTTSA